MFLASFRFMSFVEHLRAQISLGIATVRKLSFWDFYSQFGFFVYLQQIQLSRLSAHAQCLVVSPLSSMIPSCPSAFVFLPRCLTLFHLWQSAEVRLLGTRTRIPLTARLKIYAKLIYYCLWPSRKQAAYLSCGPCILPFGSLGCCSLPIVAAEASFWSTTNYILNANLWDLQLMFPS